MASQRFDEFEFRVNWTPEIKLNENREKIVKYVTSAVCLRTNTFVWLTLMFVEKSVYFTFHILLVEIYVRTYYTLFPKAVRKAVIDLLLFSRQYITSCGPRFNVRKQYSPTILLLFYPLFPPENLKCVIIYLFSVTVIQFVMFLNHQHDVPFRYLDLTCRHIKVTQVS